MAHGPITPHEVAVLAVDRVVGFELGLPYRLLGLAEDAGGSPLYRVRVATLDGRPVRTADGFSVQPDHDGSVLRSAGTVVVPGIMGGPMVREGRIPDELRAALRDAAGHARMVSICTGASVLAAAGLLDGRPAATHWRDVDAFRRNFPSVRLDPDVLFVDDGDVLTSAGVAAGIDLLLHLVRRDHGSEVANRVARRNVVAPWREGGQAQFVERPLPESGDVGTAATRAWAAERLGEPLT
ncbi:MAG TPA: DJ-1/PfpI family protein, partial [Geodermatophilus sp.]|nr:DJ-1/PfpI family protein [Geodermatophilus sp.]